MTGRPAASAHPEGIPTRAISPLPYTVKAGRAYAPGPRTKGEYHRIRLGHRAAFVRAADVTVRRAGR